MLDESALPPTDPTDDARKELQKVFAELLEEAREILRWLEAQHTEQLSTPSLVDAAPQNIDEVYDLADKLHDVVTRDDAKRAKFSRLSKISTALFTEVRSSENKQAKAIAGLLETYFRRRRRSILQKFGRTLKFPSGEIKFRVIPVSVELPEDTAPLVEELKNRRGAKKYLAVKYELDLRAIAKSPWSLRAIVRKYGGWVGRHESLSVKFADRKDAVTLSNRRYIGPTKTRRRTRKR